MVYDEHTRPGSCISGASKSEKFGIAKQVYFLGIPLKACVTLFLILSETIFFSPMPPHVLMNFRGFPPGCGDSVADF